MRTLGVAAVVLAAMSLAGCTPGSSSANNTPVAKVSPSRSPETRPSPSPSPTPAPSPAPTPAGLYLQILESSYGFLSAQTEPGTRCNASGQYPDGSAISGFANPQVAGSDGTVTWRYPQPRTNTIGNGLHTVTCTGRGYTATQQAQFIMGA